MLPSRDLPFSELHPSLRSPGWWFLPVMGYVYINWAAVQPWGLLCIPVAPARSTCASDCGPTDCDSCVMALLNDLATMDDELRLVKSQLQGLSVSAGTLEQIRRLETQTKDLRVSAPGSHTMPGPEQLCGGFTDAAWMNTPHAGRDGELDSS